MNAPWPNAKIHRLFRSPERGCSQAPGYGTAGALPPTAAAREQAARIAKADMKTHAFEGVI
ncbi:hypothetical protein CG747_20985 [Streptomyces sp. CB02959]|nr:hypothetical protein CG747_20985 [Streptomyces sp. CB02959]